MSQPTLFDPPAREVSPEREATLEARFRAFHAANPAVYDELAALARRAKSKGYARYSIKALVELVRWHRSVETTTTDGEPFRINNSHSSRYARLLMQQEADLAGFFETREIHTL